MLAKLLSFRNLIILLLLLMVGLSAYYIMQDKAAKKALTQSTSERKPALTVTSISPNIATWPQAIKLQGTVFAWQEAVVSSEVSGLRILRVNADVGQQVKRGQVLVQLADETIQAAITKQQATLAREKAALSEAKANADRAREIEATGALSSQQINQYLIAEQTANANLAFAEAELKNQQIKLKQTTIRSPDAGMITSREAKLGNVVAAGSALFTLMRQNRLEWRAEVNTQALSQIKPGQEVLVDQNNEASIKGKVRMLGPTVNNQSRNGIVYVALPKGKSKPGMFHTGSIMLGEAQALTLPQSAITLRDGMSYVFEIINNADQQSTVKQVKVALGRSHNDAIEIISGVRTNARYVASGGAFLNDGDVVRITEPQAEVAE